MKKIHLFVYVLLLSVLHGLDAADNADEDFVEIAKQVTPAYYNTYLAAKIGDEEFLVVYEPTDEEPLVKEAERQSKAWYDWYDRYSKRNRKDDPSDPEPAKPKDRLTLFKAKIGPKDKLADVARVELHLYRGGGNEIHLLNDVLYLPQSSSNRYMLSPCAMLPVNPQDGPVYFKIDKCKWRNMSRAEKDDLSHEEFCKALYKKVAVTIFDLKQKK